MKGFINIFKPEGLNSTKAVSAVKRKLNVPSGHMGTLDPMASGVLPIGVGKATRLFQYLTEKEKVYEAVFTFGYETDTLDKTGKILNTTSFIPKEEDIKSVLPSFIGNIEQIPPKISAKNVNGKRSYFLARKGIDFSLKPKTVLISDIKLVQKLSDKSYKFSIRCGGGTYIRSISRDLGEKLGSLSTMEQLIRTKSGKFTLDNAVDLEEFIASSTPLKYLISEDSVIDYPELNLTTEQFTKTLNGVFINYGFTDGLKKVYYNGEFLGVGKVTDGVLRIKSYVR